MQSLASLKQGIGHSQRIQIVIYILWSLTKVLPKNVTRSKNAVSRLYRGTQVNNEGLAGSSKICNTTIGHKRSQNVIRRMSKLEARKSYFIRRSAMIKQKIRRQFRIRYMKDLYKAKRGVKNCEHYGHGIDLDLSSKQMT